MDNNVIHIQDNTSLVELNNAIGRYSSSLQQISGEVNNHLAQALQQLQQQKEILNGRVQQAQSRLSTAQSALNACYISQAAATFAGGYVDCGGCEAAVNAAEAHLAECRAKYSAACGIVEQAEAEIAKYHGAPEQRLNALATAHTQAATQKLDGISVDTENYLSEGVSGMYLADNQKQGSNSVVNLLGASPINSAKTVTSSLAQPTQENTGNNVYNQYDTLKHLQDNAKPKSTGYCAKYIRKALNAGGINIPAEGKAAKEYTDILPEYGFESVPLEFKEGMLNPTIGFQQGDILVCQAFKGHPAGHIQMFDGDKWISDFNQKNFYIWKEVGVNEKPDCDLFRYKS